MKNIWRGSAAAPRGALASQPQTYRYKLVWNMSTSSDLRVCGSRQGFLLALAGFGVTFVGDGKRKKTFLQVEFLSFNQEPSFSQPLLGGWGAEWIIDFVLT